MRNKLWSVLATVFIAVPAFACLWDADTLRDEEHGLPGMKELMAGKFERHSDFYYKWRIEQSTKAITADANNLAAYDDLAVAHEKLGDHDQAIAVMLAKEKLKPGQYTTYANLGTFYLHKGDLDPGIEYIEKALQINPNAHFGREEYQLKLAKFAKLSKAHPTWYQDENFLFFDLERDLIGVGLGRYRHFQGDDSVAKLGLKPNVIEGITGIIRFGGKSPDLFFVLGELLAARGDRHVAFAAYQHALENGHPRAEYIKECMKQVRRNIEDHEEEDQWDMNLLKRERAEGDTWVKQYQDFEDGLIREGKDPDNTENMKPFYTKFGPATLISRAIDTRSKFEQFIGMRINSWQFKANIALGVIFLVIGLLGLLSVRWIRKRRRRKNAMQ